MFYISTHSYIYSYYIITKHQLHLNQGSMNSKESLKQARELISLKQYQQAKDICLKLISVEPLNYNAHVFLGLSEQNLNNRIASNDAYQKAIELNPSLPLAHQVINFMDYLSMIGTSRITRIIGSTGVC